MKSEEESALNQERKIDDLLNRMSIRNQSKVDLDDVKKEALTEIREKKQEERDKNKTENVEEQNTQKPEEKYIRYPGKLGSFVLEERYIGLLLNDVKNISMYYFTLENCLFEDENLLNIYKQVLFTDGEKYAPEIAKKGFNFGKESETITDLKYELKDEYEFTKYKMDKTYTELMKLFTLRRAYLENPVATLQAQIADILNYELYDRMSVEEVQGAVDQVTSTEKFKRAVLNDDLTGFLTRGDNTLTNGLELPFPILSSVFKGIRQGETSSFAMPSNAGKSRFTINIIAHLALVHKKKVLLISNEMSEEKMKLCLLTTIINAPKIQAIHGQKLHISETELLDFKFRPDKGAKVKVDEDGYIAREEGETQAEFAERIKKYSSDFNNIIKVTDWFDEQVKNKVYFINITDHTNDELKKVIMNYYYKEQVEYVFYDTLKTDIENIGNGEEVKKTATVLANMAQNFNMYIGSTLQLAETATTPLNLSINDMSASRTVKEVLDTLCLFKQIHNEDLKDYEYSLNEVDTKFYPLEKFKDPDVRYYTCVVDKNRAGSKPKLVFRLNLAYNSWEELGFIRLKSNS